MEENTNTPVLIVGLGNVGDRYAKTRHNIGFMVIEAMVTKFGASGWRTETKFKSDISEVTLGGKRVFFAKPQTMMNGSGQAIITLMNFYKITPSCIWVVSDDVDLEFGDIRLRAEGSSGGHQGLESVVGAIGTNFRRLRIGIGDNRAHNLASEDYVMQSFSEVELKQIPDIIENAIDRLEQDALSL